MEPYNNLTISPRFTRIGTTNLMGPVVVISLPASGTIRIGIEEAGIPPFR
jgi:hypothetical protein